MSSQEALEFAVLLAARDYGIGTIVFRNALAKKIGLNLTESLCLTILGTEGPSTPTEISRFTGLTTGATTTMLDRLEQRDMIRRKPNPHDRRGVIVEVNEAYSQTAQGLVAGIQKAHRDLIAGYSGEELRLIADFLRKLTINLTVHAKKIENGET